MKIKFLYEGYLYIFSYKWNDNFKTYEIWEIVGMNRFKQLQLTLRKVLLNMNLFINWFMFFILKHELIQIYYTNWFADSFQTLNGFMNQIIDFSFWFSTRENQLIDSRLSWIDSQTLKCIKNISNMFRVLNIILTCFYLYAWSKII